MTRVFIVGLLLLSVTSASAQLPPSVELTDPIFEFAPIELEAQTTSRLALESPGWERGLLETAGVGLGIASALAAGVLVMGVAYACGRPCNGAGVLLVLGTPPLALLFTIPAGVFLVGSQSGRGADFGWTLLGGVLGALPGAAMVIAGYRVDEGSHHDPSLLYAGGSVLAGVGVIAGSILAFEVSSHSNVRVDAGLGSLSVRGRFD